MANGKTFTVTEHLNSEEDFDALQEVTAGLEQAEARIEELEAKMAKAAKALEYYGGWSDGSGGIRGFDGGSLASTTLAELKGQDDE